MVIQKIATSFQSSAIRLIISILLLFTFTSPAFAQASTPSSAPPTTNYQLPTNVSPTSPLYTDLLVHNIFHTFSCLAVGQSVISQPCLDYVKGVPVLSSVNLSGGALGATTSMIGMLFANPPVRTADYLASVGTSLGIVKEANAQVGGSGANVLSPIISLWQVSRNISYVLMIIIFVVIGLMIVFRQKINPQTVITAQAALPGLVIGLILITFSYFLAGLISDTAFIGTNLVGAYFSAVKGQPPQNLVQGISSESVLGIFGNFLGGFNQGTVSFVTRTVFDKLHGDAQFWVKMITGIMAFQAGASFGGPIGALGASTFCAPPAVGAALPTGGLSLLLLPLCATLGPLAGQALGGGALMTAAMLDPGGTIAWPLYFAALAALIYAMVMLLLRLINSFLTIIFLTISAPFQFLFSSLPGRQGIATDWIMNLLGNVLVFPAVIALFYFVAFILGTKTGPLTVSSLNNDGMIPKAYAQEQIDIVGSSSFPLFGGLNLDFIKFLVAFGALMATPAIPDIVVKAIGKASQAGQAIGQEIQGGIRSGQGYAGRVTGAPGQLGQGLGQLQQLGGKYEEGVSSSGMPYQIWKPGLVDRLRGGPGGVSRPL